MLKSRGVPSAFFWNTRTLFSNRPWNRLLNEGHLLGSHAHTHVNLDTMPSLFQKRQLEVSCRQLQKITGRYPLLFRPPFGRYNKTTLEVLRGLKMQMVLWNISSLDWELRKDPQQIVRNVVNNLQPGGIILLHELPQTLRILPELLDKIMEAGYECIIPDSVNFIKPQEKK
ncbi:polysaccharide deacetylase family protein [Alkalicoccus saliphilus]|uniref:Polysaccharide deacetylase family protein n=1 Tax=Alkalicoccus saliphilus TaxID=200989 RepID=A0A2T4U7Y5_9BACI|nr:polysaccharide deacetylase family protein [Alkalicoccus saliphilus]